MDGFTVALPHPHGVRRDATGLLAVLALLLFAGWGALAAPAIHLGIPSVARHRAAAPAAPAPSIDAASVAEQAGHAVTAVPGEAGALRVADPGYDATFDHAGVHFTPAGAASGLGIGLAAIQRGSAVVPVTAGPWTADLNVAQRTVAEGVQERATARRGTVEWDVVLDHPVHGTGDLVVTADLAGVTGAPTVGADGLTLALETGGRVELGQTVVVDATGTELFRATPTVTAGQIALTVPASVLDGATYPLTIDPVVSSATTVTSNPFSIEPAVAFDGTNFLVAFTDYAGSGAQEVRGALVSADGSQVQPLGAISTQDSTTDVRPSIAWNGTTFLVVWEHAFSASDHDIYARRVSTNGTLLDIPFPLASSPIDQVTPSVTTGGGGTFYAVWTAKPSSEDIYGGRVSSAGALLDGNGGRQVVGAATGDTAPDVAWNGSAYLVTYQRLLTSNDPDIYGQIVDASGNPFAVTFPIGNQGGVYEQHPRIASNGSEYLVVWQADSDVLGKRVTGDGALLNAVTVSAAAQTQSAPDVTFNGSYFVAWRDRRDQGHNAVWAARVSTNGTNQDPDGILVEPSPTNAGFTGAAVGPGPGGKWAVEADGALSLGLLHRTVAPK